LPHSVNRAPLIAAAREANPACRILVRARYLRERAELEQAGADGACFEEAEAAGALAERVLRDLGRDEDQARAAGEKIRREFGEWG
jgi:CPA2 family monovalent cation:H+ antiporter-2